MMSVHKKAKKPRRTGVVAVSDKVDLSEDDIRLSIFKALNNNKYKARTITGVVSETRLPTSVVINAIKNDSVLVNGVKIYSYRSKDGSVLITTKDRFMNESSFKDKFIDFFSTSREKIPEILEVSESGEESMAGEEVGEKGKAHTNV